MHLSINRGFRSDLNHAMRWYAEQASAEAAEALHREVSEALASIERNPYRFAMAEIAAETDELRSLRLHRFPYEVLFRTANDEARILVLRHCAQDSSYGLDRT